jgi:cell wall-associated NlpC family hydrolase
MCERPIVSLMRPPQWVRDYVGIPFAEHGRTREGCDCWGLVRLVLGERWRVWLPSFARDYRDTEETDAIARTIIGEQGKEWRRISGPFFREGDVALFRLAGRPVHVGLIVGWPWMLHIERGIDAACDRIDGLRWARRLDSVWRHPDLIP